MSKKVKRGQHGGMLSLAPVCLLIALLMTPPLAELSMAQTLEPSPSPQLRGWRTNTEKRSIDLAELMSGGPPKDGIPALTQPKFVSAEEASHWLKPNEPVISLAVEGEAHAYPLQILIWHEIVNDQIAGIPVAVTFCPLCYSAVAFNRTIAGRVHTFGVSGFLRHSDMVMYDRETESLWQQITGEGLVGDWSGVKLKALPAQIVAFEQFVSAYPKGQVLSRDTGYRREYGRNPYTGYDDIAKSPRLYRGKLDPRVPPMEKLVVVSVNGLDKVYPYSVTRQRSVIHDEIKGQPIVIFHGGGAVSALDQADISKSREVGSTGVFDPRLDGRALKFKLENGQFVDKETGSVWDITGQARQGTLKGRRLNPITHGDYFAFAWLSFRPKSEIYRP